MCVDYEVVLRKGSSAQEWWRRRMSVWDGEKERVGAVGEWFKYGGSDSDSDWGWGWRVKRIDQMHNHRYIKHMVLVSYFYVAAHLRPWHVLIHYKSLGQWVSLVETPELTLLYGSFTMASLPGAGSGRCGSSHNCNSVKFGGTSKSWVAVYN